MKAGLQFVAAAGSVQVLSWLFGFADELTKFLVEHRDLTVLGIILYFGIYYICYDVTYRAEKLRYNERLKGTPLRRIPVSKTRNPNIVGAGKRRRDAV
ncbi:hypothetical protein [Pseudaminobacter soli (ex Li et al. 2025)]|uniref:Uncharacterized protein n=1 Tax=Pseudaminobacter soli (ex Li et al. 2025) TaxID=1295366 RepID=A0A2P7RZT7_9HYPH|nr:hypothetical protein [Mesorhizobium soli]PSJ55745.1 hypothetical protein C7I85_25995 [Mesorhizobium soli]